MSGFAKSDIVVYQRRCIAWKRDRDYRLSQSGAALLDRIIMNIGIAFNDNHLLNFIHGGVVVLGDPVVLSCLAALCTIFSILMSVIVDSLGIFLILDIGIDE